MTDTVVGKVASRKNFFFFKIIIKDLRDVYISYPQSFFYKNSLPLSQNPTPNPPPRGGLGFLGGFGKTVANAFAGEVFLGVVARRGIGVGMIGCFFFFERGSVGEGGYLKISLRATFCPKMNKNIK